MLAPVMNRALAVLLILTAGLAPIPSAPAQDSDAFAGVDLLYPEFAHSQEDLAAAIKSRDYRFIAVDRRRRDIPGVERGRMVQIHGTKVIRQRFRIFATQSQNFSFALRARAYADEYNRALLRFLQQRDRKK